MSNNYRMNEQYNRYTDFSSRQIYLDYFGTDFKAACSFTFASSNRTAAVEDYAGVSNERIIKKINETQQYIQELIEKIESFINATYQVKTAFVEKLNVFNKEFNIDEITFYKIHFVLLDGILIEFTLNNDKFSQLIIFGPTRQQVEQFKDLHQFCNQLINVPEERIPTITLIGKNNHGFEAFSKPIKKYDTEFSLDFYNEDFSMISKGILSKLDKNDINGLILLHGGIGTGKTNYIKYLIGNLKKKVFYVPPDIIPALSDPSFIKFVSYTLQNSVLIIEDAENVLKSREGGGNHAVSNILNMSNGILGDILNICIICTFNCDKELIDKALLRPGRLIASYEFKELSLEKTNNLLEKLYGEAAHSDKPMTLAEIFNKLNMPLIRGEEKISIGFV